MLCNCVNMYACSCIVDELPVLLLSHCHSIYIPTEGLFRTVIDFLLNHSRSTVSRETEQGVEGKLELDIWLASQCSLAGDSHFSDTLRIPEI